MTDEVTIIHVLPHTRDIGNGIVNSTVDLAIEQAKSDFAVHVFSAGGDYVALLKGFGVTHHEAVINLRRPPTVLSSAGKLRKIIRQVTPTVLHAHTPASTVVAALAANRTRVPVVATAHNAFDSSVRLLALSSHIVAVSDSNALQISAWAGREKVSVVKNAVVGSERRNGVETDDVDLRSPAVVYTGGLSHRKGIDVLLEAFDRLDADRIGRPTLYIVGDGPSRDELEATACRSRCGSHVKFVGFDRNPEKYMRACDVFVVPSRAEPFGLVLAEARSCGAAIVASAVDGIPETLDGGRAGRLVPAGSAVDLAQAIEDLLANPEDREALKRDARQNLAWLRVSRMCSEVSRVYERVAGTDLRPRTVGED